MQVNAHRDAPKRNAHCTKAGPGRRHVQDLKHGAAPVADKGAPFGFVQRANPERAKIRRRITAFGGIRQYKLAMRALRALKANLSEVA